MGMTHGDRVLETTTTTSTGDITLAGAITGYRTMASVATTDGDMFPYVIAGPSEWEVGIGTRLSATTFARTTVTASSNAGALVNFSAGVKEVWMDFSSALINFLRASNLTINGGMEVSQERGTTLSAETLAFGVYGVDMYSANLNDANNNIGVKVQQVADAPPGFKYSMKMTVSTAKAVLSVLDAVYIQFSVEGYNAARLGFGAAGAQSISRSIWCKAHRTGTYTMLIWNSAFNRTYLLPLTINAADTWEYKTFVIPGDTTGTWTTDNSAALQCVIVCAAGSSQATGSAGAWTTYQGALTTQVNAVAATSDTFQICGDSIVPGTVLFG